MTDPNFARTVVLIAEHTDEGAMGLVLNRPAMTTVGDAVPDLAWLTDDDAQVDVGGALVEDDLGFIGADADDRDVLDGAVRRARVFAGHAGWGPGQLEDEIA